MLSPCVKSVKLAPSFERTKMWEFDRENRWAVNMATPYTVGTPDAIGFFADSSCEPVKFRGGPDFRIPIRDSVALSSVMNGDSLLAGRIVNCGGSRRSFATMSPDRHETARSVMSSPLSIIAKASRISASVMHSGGLVKNVFQRTNV
jgi:hypothetical protein